MKIASLFLAAIAFALTPAGAQTSAAGANNQQSDNSATVTGCLGGQNDEGAYVLKTGSGAIEVGGANELQNHVGHKVKLTGEWAKSGSEIGERESSESEQHEARERGQHPQEQHLKVSNIEMISSNCK
jgi:hypothetical protein